MYLKSKFYPVDYEHKIIYDDPQPRERDCAYGKLYDVIRTHTIGTKGAHLDEYAKRYASFEVRPPMDARKTKLVQTALFDESAVDDWGDSADLRKQNAGMKRLL